MSEKNVIKEQKKLWFYDWWWNIPSGFDKDGNFNPNEYDPNAPYIIKWKTFRLKSNPEQELEDPYDLNNLRFINPENVVIALKSMEDLVQHGRELICMIWTGGTISMILKNGKLAPWLNPNDLLKFAWGWLNDRFWIVSFEIVTPIDSSQMEIDYIADIVIAMSWFYENLSNHARTKFCWFFITHWTDTLNQSSTYANVMLWANYPFNAWFVAAQKTIVDKFSDVWVNFTFWLNMLSELRRSRTNIVFASIWWTWWWAYMPATSVKISDSDVNAFDSPWRNKLMDVSNFVSGWIDTLFIDEREKNKTVDDIFQPIILRGHTSVSTIVAKIGINPDKLYEYVKSIHDLAILLVTYWAFTFSRKQVNAILKAAKENKAALFAANPFPTWSTTHIYTEALYLKEQWITPINSLEHSVYAKIKWAQAVWGNDLHKIKMFLIWNNFMWEQPNNWEPPLEVIEELVKYNWFKIRKIWQPIDSIDKL